MMPSLSGLRAFDAAARLGSFKAAAGELNVTPTAISHQVRTLEEQLGYSLFVREVRNIRLTKEGSELSIATNKAFSTLAEAISSLEDSEKKITVSTTPAFAALWMVPRVKDFEELNPGFSLNVTTSTKITDLSRDRSVDFVIRYGARDQEKGGVTGFCSRKNSVFLVVLSS
jgi:LysR family transcriptional regulator, glycine cleavage system transcriptional activator